MTRKTFAALMGTTAITFMQPVTAQEAFDLDTIVVSGSLSPIEAERSGASVNVVDAEKLSTTDTTVIDRLDRLPGVSSTANGGLGASSNIQIRGLPARYVSVRVNGIDVANPSGVQNQFNFGGLTPSGISRIEVLKGSQSALYGSEAIAGLIDITSYRPQELGFSGDFTAEAGGNETYQGTLNMGVKSVRGEIALTYGRTTSEGISARAGDPEKDGFEQDTLILYGEYDLSDNVTLGATVFYRDGSVEIDRSATNNSGEVDTEETGYRVFGEVRTGPVTHTLSFAFFDIARRDPGGFTPRFDGERRQFSYLGSYEISPTTAFNFGFDRTEEEFQAGAVGDNDTNSVQAELLFSPSDALDVSAAIRHDDESDFGGKTTGRIAAVWRPVQDLAFRAVAGTGFRAPSLFERFSASGDPTLKPEESISYELGVEKRFGEAGFVKATLFHTEIDDLIQFDTTAVACGSGFGCYNQVPGTTTSKGIELSGEYALNGAVTVYGNYTYTDAETNGARLTRTPKHDVTLGITGEIGQRVTAEADIRHVADIVPSAFAPANNKVGDYTLVGAGVTFAVTDRAEAYLRVENLFDEDYETAGGFNTPGRTAFVGVRASF